MPDGHVGVEYSGSARVQDSFGSQAWVLYEGVLLSGLELVNRAGAALQVADIRIAFETEDYDPRDHDRMTVDIDALEVW